jgi:hypothetical protein
MQQFYGIEAQWAFDLIGKFFGSANYLHVFKRIKGVVEIAKIYLGILYMII